MTRSNARIATIGSSVPRATNVGTGIRSSWASSSRTRACSANPSAQYLMLDRQGRADRHGDAVHRSAHLVSVAAP
jgi:hypothetical protein